MFINGNRRTVQAFVFPLIKTGILISRYTDSSQRAVSLGKDSNFIIHVRNFLRRTSEQRKKKEKNYLQGITFDRMERKLGKEDYALNLRSLLNNSRHFFITSKLGRMANKTCRENGRNQRAPASILRPVTLS